MADCGLWRGGAFRDRGTLECELDSWAAALAFSTQSRNDTRKTGVCAVRVALVPAETLALDAQACTPGTEGVVSGPGRWFWIPNDGSTAVAGSEAVPSSCGFRGGSRKEDNAITGGSCEDVVSAVYYLIASH